MKEKVMSMKDIRVKLAKEELLRSGEGTEIEREDTLSTFIVMGLEIEESQRYLTIDVKARIRTFRKLQRSYMPNLHRFLSGAQRAQWDTETDRDAEAVRLFMPSDIADRTKREKVCAQGLSAVEADLREGECRDTLEALRSGLRTRTMTNRFRLRNCTGQRALTWGQGVLRQLNLRIHKAKSWYRYARNTLLRLRGHGGWEQELQVLKDDDVRALNERALTEEERAQKSVVHDFNDVEEGGVATFGVVALGEGRRTLSWIWYVSKAGEPTEADLVEALRVKWCKAYARMWPTRWLHQGAQRSNSVDPVLDEGLRAYALEQSARELETCEQLRVKWVGLREKARAFLARETAPGMEVIVPLDGTADDDDDEEGTAQEYEDEGDEDLLE
ncbi:hypothetical protein DFH07DRAFT_966118 [Mycena maculata]|uniref:Uncharacterized protein n=1 Tax=Mycena maculata TaxID=230809 RepID=A0AAD7MYI2_9AGAR|nr:hypothetical protein DFH07DRAFT_966118 [Mycena maculata]